MLSSKRNPNIDFAKGALIILVVAGHLLPGTIEGSFARFLIYFFHMPVFFAICGYLIPRSKLASTTPKELVAYYVPRVVIPWFLAVLIYYTLVNAPLFEEVSPETFAGAFICPYLHLWFIIAFVTFIAMTKAFIFIGSSIASIEDCSRNLMFKEGRSSARCAQFKRRRLRLLWIFLLTVATLISVSFLIYNQNTYATGEYTDAEYTVMHDFHFFYYIYFVFGMFLREYTPRFKPLMRKALYVVTTVLAAAIPFSYAFGGSPAGLALKYAFNLCLITCMIHAFENRSLPRNRFLENIGRNSLAYYLYLQAGKTITVHFFTYADNPVAYWCTAILLTFGIYLLIGALGKIPAVSRLFFGILPRRSRSKKSTGTSLEIRPYRVSPMEIPHPYGQSVRRRLSYDKSVV
ncbi:MAG: acyltransferase [Eubacterium sp.]|nr:acyltransferase [Eubacterium sp.]